MFLPGEYYVGDLVRVLPSDALRMLMSEILKYGGLKNLASIKELVYENEADHYWITKTPHTIGSFYDQNNKGWGFDWGMFGCMSFKWVNACGCHDQNKVYFKDQFDCEATDDLVRIGHLTFTLNPNTK